MNEQTGELETWQDVVDVVNEVWGTSLCESTVRKAYNGFKKMLPAYLAKRQDSNQETKELEVIKLEIQKEKQKLYDQRREFNSLARKAARSENLEDALACAADGLNQTLPLIGESYVSDFIDDSEAVLTLCDWHYGLVIENIWNTYNVNVCKHRIEVLKEQVIKKLRMHSPVKLHVLLLGDLANGVIHTSSRVASEEGAADELMQVSEIVAEFIAEISRYVPSVDVHCNYGNHMRSVQNVKDSIHSDNMERIIGWWLVQRLQNNKNIHIIEPEYYEFTLITAAGNNIVAVHGDLEKGFDSIPVTMNMLFTKKLGIGVDYTISADKHHLEAVDKFGVQSFLAPSLCSTDNYANDIRAYSHPSQILMFFNKRGLDDLCDIRVDIE